MTAAQRLLPDSTNGTPPYDALTWQRKANTEVGALWKCAPTRLTSVSGTNDITASSDTALVVAISAYAQPMAFWLIPANTNTGGVTINIDGVGVKNLKDNAGATLAGGDLVAGSTYLIWYDGTGFRVVGGSVGSSGLPSTAPDMILRDEKTTNTDGGTFTSGGFAKRTLNTAVRNALAGASLSASQFTLQAGTYYIEWGAPAYRVGSHQTRLYNATDASTVETGTSEHSNETAAYAITFSRGCAVVTITSAKAFEIDHICGVTRATDGLGLKTNLAAKEVYTWVNIWKVGTLASQVDGIPGGGINWQQNFSTTTADADPGDSTFRLNNATQNTATAAYLDLSDVGLTNITSILESLDDLGQTTQRGYLRLAKYDDPTKWLVFLVTGAVVSASGYRKFTLSILAYSAASPFSNGDRVNFSFAPIGSITAVTRDRLSADRTYYVRSDGNNANTGLTNDSSGAWLTLVYAASYIMANLDLAGFNVTVNVADGTYAPSGGLSLGPYVGRAAQGHTGPVIFVGNTSTPSNVVLDAAGSANTITASETGGLEWIFKGVKIQNTTGASGVVADASGWVVLDNVVFGACASGLHVQAENGGIVEFISNYTVAGNAVAHLYSISRGQILYTGGQTVTVNNGLTFSSFFAGVDSNAMISAVNVTYSLVSGAPTGTKYNQQNGGVFLLNSDGSYKDPNTVFPGSASGFAYGSTNFEATAVVGDIPYAGATTPYWSRLASVAVGHELISGGVSTAPAYVRPDFSGARNLQLNASVASSKLTIAVKAASTGNDPSATAPVMIPFRDSTIANGDPVWRAVTGALSIDTNAVGATLGTANSVPFRLWVVAFDNAGTVVLALYQTVVGGASPTAISPLNPSALASSTAISGSATSAGVFYTPNGTTVSSKAFCILGYVDYASGLATAGTYASAPTTVQLMGPGIKLPGQIVQSVLGSSNSITNNSTNAYATTNVSASISPTAAPNLVRAAAYGSGRTDGGGSAIISKLHRGSTAIGSEGEGFSAGGASWSTHVNFALDAPGTTSSTTYAVKIKNTDNATQASYPKGNAADTGIIMLDELMV